MQLSTRNRRLICLGLLASITTACGIEINKKKDDSKSNGGIPADVGTIAFDLSSIQLDESSADTTPASVGAVAPSVSSFLPGPGPTAVPPIVPGAKLLITYFQHCEVAQPTIGASEPYYDDRNEARNEARNEDHTGGIKPISEKCYQGSLTVDLKQSRKVSIDKIPAGLYTFTALLYGNQGGLFKRGSATIQVAGGSITQGKIVLHKVFDNGGVIIDIVDGDSPVSSNNSCVEYKRLGNTIRPLLCEVGEFKCSYEKFSATASCDEFSARLDLMKQLCEQNIQYDPTKLQCTKLKEK